MHDRVHAGSEGQVNAIGQWGHMLEDRVRPDPAGPEFRAGVVLQRELLRREHDLLANLEGRHIPTVPVGVCSLVFLGGIYLPLDVCVDVSHMFDDGWECDALIIWQWGSLARVKDGRECSWCGGLVAVVGFEWAE